MDQDFHYYGTYYAARTGGFDQDEATLIAKASNFIDFFTNETYAAYWKLVSETEKSDSYDVVAQLDYPRYTFQGGFLSPLLSPEDGLWCSYHFTPGNYNDPPNTPSRETVHGQSVTDYLPKFETRDTTQGRATLEEYDSKSLGDLEFGQLLNRPQSALSRQIIMDTLKCAASDARLESILGYAIGGQVILQNNREDNLRRFKLILLGIRAHVIADTWAHQDFCGLNNVMNTYWDVNWEYGRQSIDYDDGTTSGWRNQVLSGVEAKIGRISKNFEAVPNGTSYLGHSWMGHLPDFSFVKFRYKPCWADPSTAIERNNPQQYQSAWVELVSLFTQAKGSGQLELDEQFRNDLTKAIQAIQSPCRLEDSGNGRKSSANAWQRIFGDLPSINIDADLEPDPNAVLDGAIEMTKRTDRYGTDYIHINSDLYLFQIAADYHFHFVKNYLERHGIYRFTGSWSQQTSALSPDVSSLFEAEGDKAAIEMTLGGVLLAGKWRRADELERMTQEDMRNTLIVEMSQQSNQSVQYFQKFDDNALVGKGATVVFLMEARIRDSGALKNMSDDDQRNTLIVENGIHTSKTGPEMWGMSDQQLVQLGLEWFVERRFHQWQKDNWETIKDKRLWQVATPATHDSGCYGECWQGVVDHARLEYNPRSKSQGASIYEQLVYGIRSFDLRFRNYGDKYYVFHGSDVFDITLYTVLNDIKKFLDETEKEILILVFRFEEKSGQAEVLEKIGANIVLSKDDVTHLGRNWPANCTPEELIEIGKRVILLWSGEYDEGALDKNGHRDDQYIWYSPDGNEYIQITQAGNYGGAHTVDELIEGRSRDLEWWRHNCRNIYFANSGKYWFRLGVHLTTNPRWNLQTLAEESLPVVLEKLGGDWKNEPWNIVAADLFDKKQYLDFSEAVIDLNNNNFPYNIPNGQ